MSHRLLIKTYCGPEIELKARYTKISKMQFWPSGSLLPGKEFSWGICCELFVLVS